MTTACDFVHHLYGIASADIGILESLLCPSKQLSKKASIIMLNSKGRILIVMLAC